MKGLELLGVLVCPLVKQLVHTFDFSKLLNLVFKATFDLQLLHNLLFEHAVKLSVRPSQLVLHLCDGRCELILRLDNHIAIGV